MIARPNTNALDAPAVVIDIGNTKTSVAIWQSGELKTPLGVPTNDHAALGNAIRTHMEATPKGRARAVVAGSVVPDALRRVLEYVSEVFDQDALVVGETIPLPIEVAIADAKMLGVDRACAAAAAYETLQAACTIVDFGSAVTVDLVDDDGRLLGGAILPGAAMQLRALHEHTATLPEVEAAIPKMPFGRDTAEAIQVGVCCGIAGAVRELVEAYASHLSRWPQVIATGGDLRLFAPQCDFLDTVVDHLVLRGVGLAHTKYLEAMGA